MLPVGPAALAGSGGAPRRAPGRSASARRAAGRRGRAFALRALRFAYRWRNTFRRHLPPRSAARAGLQCPHCRTVQAQEQHLRQHVAKAPRHWRLAAQLGALDASVRGGGGSMPGQARHCLRSCRDERGVYHCPRCARQYRHKQSLSRHLQHECDRRRWLACPRCPHRTASAARLRLHMAAVHQLALALPALASAFASSQ
ncbi:Uncharacterized protein GBIM_12630 [Gryllus bimaculatus]|nr:Uncharacterized protein GBIM_12630 [Gryllus bimaculatus]